MIINKRQNYEKRIKTLTTNSRKLSLLINAIGCNCPCLNKMAGSRDFLAEKNWEEEIQPFLLFEKLFFALFGVTGPSDIMISKYLQVVFYAKLFYN